LEAQIAAIAERQLRTHCVCFTPNEEHVEDVLRLSEQYQVAVVVHYSLAFCQPYILEEIKVKKVLEQRNIPVLALESEL
jgi:benzoyl-CoA reductase/2-hydroxyglutaryl-CoA dehydratase subunit BcrC/BadD/HgdB